MANPSPVDTTLTLSQMEVLFLVRSGQKAFYGRTSRSVAKLVDSELITAEFDVTSPDPLRGRLRDVWRACTITKRGLQVCEAFTARFQPLMVCKGNS